MGRTKPMSASRVRRSNRNRVDFSVVPLEKRLLLAQQGNLFANLAGDVGSGADTNVSPVSILESDFEQPHRRILLGFSASADESALDPGRIRIVPHGSSTHRPVLQKLNTKGSLSSLSIAWVGTGNYALKVDSQNRTSGSYSLDVFLAGDANGDFRVDTQDLQLIRSLRNVRSHNSRYVSEADVDRNGIINSYDSHLANANRGASTRLRPLSLTAQLDPDSISDGVVNRPDVAVIGMTLPNATVRMDQQSDGSFEQFATADASGAYRFNVVIDVGATPFRIEARDTFGQRVVSELVVNRVDRPTDFEAPSILISSPSPGLTSATNITIQGRVTDDGSGVGSLQVALDGGTATDLAFDASGNFSYTTNLVLNGSADGPHTLRFLARDWANNSRTLDFPWILDATAPQTLTFRLDPFFDTAPVGDQVTRFSSVFITGQTEPNVEVRLEVAAGSAGAVSGQPISTASILTTIADAQGRFTVQGIDLTEGANRLMVTARDSFGREITTTETVTRVPLPAGTQVLKEEDQFTRQVTIPVTLGQAKGSRKFRFELDAGFDTTDRTPAVEDLVLVYLVDPSDPTKTLLDRGENGTALFTKAGDTVEMAPGIVRYDGTAVEIDVTSLGNLTEGRLVVQVINSDGDSRSVYHVLPLSYDLDPEGLENPRFLAARRVVETAGDELDLGTLSSSTSVKVLVSNVRFDSTKGLYTAELRLRNDGASVGRKVAAVFPGLPDDVELPGNSGFDGSGNPYINFEKAIPAGGLAAMSESSPVLVTFTNPDSLRFALRPQVLVSTPNRAPTVAPIGLVTVRPGQRLEIPISTSDPDGDPVSVSLVVQPGQALPGITLTASRTLVVAPTPDQIGDYTLTLLASDGAVNVTQQVAIRVEEDAVTTTRISGRVLNTDGEPLANVPVSLGTLQALTDTQGAFTFTLPPMAMPTDGFDIVVPTGDLQFDPQSTGDKFIRFQRTRFAPTTGTSTTNPREFPNLITSFLDANFVYGSDAVRASALRTNDGTGRLKTSPGDLLPLNNATYFPNGPLPNDNNGIHDPQTLFVAGDNRANENIGLAALHTVFVREHNRLADEIRAASPGLPEEEIYQQSRRLVGAIIQSITYNEYLPLVLGPNALASYAGYDPTIDPSAGAFFATVAFRFAHSQSFPEFPLLNQLGGQPFDSLSLSEATFNSEAILANGVDPILRGLYAQPTNVVGLKHIDAVRNVLFGPPGSNGIDLVATDIQRARDLGIPSYNQARLDLGLTAVTSFAQVSSNASVRAALQATYGSVDKLDALIGGLAEDKVPGSLVGPLFNRSIQDQFRRLRDGDRFWFENGQFTESELSFIRSSTLATVLHRTTGTSDLPANVFSKNALPVAPAPGGTIAAIPPGEFRTINGTGNNPNDPSSGATGDFLRRDTSAAYGDGISTPGGSDRPNARAISNAVAATSTFTTDPSGATALGVIWAQLLSHDVSFTPPGTPDTLKIFGTALAGTDQYPFIAEKVDLLLGRPVYVGFDNVIPRPIYLPVLNAGTPIDPAANTMVENALRPGEANTQVFVAAGTLETREGNLFTGNLSITEVPVSLTPAALPQNLMPDIVITVQPGEMVFNTPAPLTFPNRSGWEPGTIMDLWSINPVTGDFDKVGKMKVSADGTKIETIEGGIRNSSWHFPTPPPDSSDDPNGDDNNEDDQCQEAKADVPATSIVELHSGNLRESHDLVSYQSLGVTRGLTLSYDSLRANPQPIVSFGYSNVVALPSRRLMARMEIRQGDLRVQVPGFAGGQFNLPGGEHFWKITKSGDFRVALQADMTGLPTGIYEYDLTTGLLQFSGDNLTGSTTRSKGQLVHVNSIGSIFGNGWGLSGLLQVIENPDGSVLLVNGDGGELVFGRPSSPGQPYVSPPGDFSSLTKQPDGTFRRTHKDTSVETFDSSGFITSIKDRNGNTTVFEYAGPGRLSKVIDPVQLETRLLYTGDRVTSIIDPASRETKLEYDTSGNLVKVTDPDGTSRTWEYDTRHLMTAEIDKRGFREESFYNFAGRVVRAVRKDGSEMLYEPTQTQVLYPATRTIDPANPPSVTPKVAANARYADANGNVTELQLDKAGQVKSAQDSVGRLPSVVRNNQNLVVNQLNARGNPTNTIWDEKGNPVEVIDYIGISDPGGSILFDGNDIVSIPHNTVFDTIESTDKLSLEAWIRIDGLPQRWFSIVDKYESSRDFGWTFQIFDGQQMVFAGGIGPSATAAYKFDLNLWYHVAFAYDRSQKLASFYVNGELIQSVAYDADIQDTFGEPMYLGYNPSGGNEYSLGAIDELRLWNRALSAEEISRNFTRTISWQESGLVGHWKFDEGDGNIVKDSSGNGLNGTLSSDNASPSWSDGFQITRSSSKKFTYDTTFNLVTSFTDELGQQTFFDRDAATGNTQSITRVVGERDTTENGQTDDLVTRYTYTSRGLIDTVEDPLGRLTDYDYDNLGRLVTVTYAMGTPAQGIFRYEYDTAGNRTAKIDENNHRTEYVYDALNQLIQTTQPDPDGAGPLTSPITRMTYDPVGNMETVTDARNNTTRYEYDTLSRQVRMVAPDPDGAGPLASPVSNYSYDDVGNLVSVVDPLGQTTQRLYDGRNRLVAVIDPDGGWTSYRYDNDDNLVALTDPVGNTTRFAYDSRNRLVAETDPLQKTIVYEYDAANNLRVKTDRNNRRTVFDYDELNRLINEQWFNPGGTGAVNTVTYAYDKVGNLRTVADASSALTMTHDARNRVDTVDNAGTAGAPNVVLTYTYDGVGNVRTVSDTIEGVAGATTTYGYDALDRLLILTQAGGGTSDKRVEFAYNPLSKYASINRYSDFAATQLVAGTNYSYDAMNRLANITHRNAGGGTIAFYDYTYDTDSRITRIVDVNGTTDYIYDDRDQLTGADRSNESLPDETFRFDANGNRLESSQHGTGYLTGPANRLLSDGTYNYTYDDEGNMRTRTEIATGAVREFTWDHRNRLVSVVDKNSGGEATQEVRFGYDALDRRIAKAVDTPPLNAVDAAIEHYFYDREDIILDFIDDEGAGWNPPVLVQRYLHGPEMDMVLARDRQGEGLFWLLPDHQGTIRDIVMASETLDTHFDFDSYGRSEVQLDGSIVSRYLFTNREFDHETQLYFMRARYYDPAIGRFISEDPTRVIAWDVNLNRFMLNDPTQSADPTGEAPGDKTFGLPKPFWKWYHRQVKRPGDPDIQSREEALEQYEEWIENGKPDAEGKPTEEPDDNSDEGVDNDTVERIAKCLGVSLPVAIALIAIWKAKAAACGPFAPVCLAF